MSSRKGGIERRKHRRRPILETFSFFVVVPKKGFHRLAVADVSDSGIGFDFDIGGESAEDFPVVAGEEMAIQFYLNQSLFIPLTVRVMRVDDSQVIRRVGAEFVDTGSRENKALQALLSMIDEISEVVQFTA